MSSLSQFFPAGSGTPVHGFVYAGAQSAPSAISSTGNQVYVRSGATIYGASASNISKVQTGTAPGYAVPGTGIFSNFASTQDGVSIVYNNGIWLRSTSSGLYRSTDGLSWTPIIYNTDNAGQYIITSKIVFMNNVFMFMVLPISYNVHTPRVYSSADGITWSFINMSFATTSTNSTTLSVANGMAFAIITTTQAFKPIIYVSTDAINWKPIITTAFSNSFRLNEVVFGNSKYIVTSPDTSTVYGSTDGLVWTTSGSAAAATQARYLNSLWVVLGTSAGVIFTSTDGSTWTSRTSNVASQLLRVEFAFGLYVAMGAAGVCTTSPTGTTWTARTSNSNTVTSLILFNSLLIAQSSTAGYASSPDGITWTARTAAYSTGTQPVSNPQTNSVLATDGSTLLSMSGPSNGQITSTTNGTTYNQVLNVGGLLQANGDASLQLVNNRLFQLPPTGGIQTADPSTHSWKLVLNSGASVFFSAGIAFGNSVYVAAGQGGNIYSSSDGITWTSRTSGTASAFLAIGYANGLFVAIGNGICRTSPDGITWTARASMTINASMLVYANNIWLSFQQNSTNLQTSLDGITWTVPTNTIPSSYTYVKAVGELFIFLNIAATTGRYCVFDGVTFIEFGNSTASTYCSDAVESNGIYYVVQTDGTVYSAVGKYGALGSNGWATQTIQASSAAVPTNPGFTGALVSGGAGIGKGPQNEIFFFTPTQLAAAPDGGTFSPISIIVTGNGASSVLNPTNRFQIIIGSNYAYVTANHQTEAGYLFFNRNTLTSSYPSVTEGSLRTTNATANFASFASYRRIA